MFQEHLSNATAQTYIEHHGSSAMVLRAKTCARKDLVDMERSTVFPHDGHRLHRAIAAETRNNIDALAVHTLHFTIF